MNRAYCRQKAAHCFDLAERPEHRGHAKMLVRLGQRFLERALARPELG